jgi:Membrane-bound metallopeptidase
MKYLKKISYIILIAIMISLQVVIPDFREEATAKSLRDLRGELAELEVKQEESKKAQAATEAQIAAAKAQIVKLSKEKEDIENDIDILNAEIEQLNKDIVAKNEEIKDIISYYQLSATGEDAYLEYVFTATDFTDFIYRMAIAEQLSNYNTKLINEYNDLITKNEKKKEELSDKIVELNAKTKELEKKVSELQVELKDNIKGALSIEDEIKLIKQTLKSYIELYETYKCEEDLEHSACLAKVPANVLPPGTAFYRPVVTGRVSSNYGSRTYTLGGKVTTDFHYGLDFSSSHGNNVYAVANGRVVAIVNRSSCGGNMVYIAHTVNNKNYTSSYYHLASIKVKTGDIVTYNSVIGTVGGNPSIETWDRCSTGSHVHLQLATGHYMSDYFTYSGFVSKTFNPRNVLNAPPLGGTVTNRTTKY